MGVLSEEATAIFAFFLSRGQLLKERICSWEQILSFKSRHHFKELSQRSKQEYIQVNIALFADKKPGVLIRAGAFNRINMVCKLFLFKSTIRWGFLFPNTF